MKKSVPRWLAVIVLLMALLPLSGAQAQDVDDLVGMDRAMLVMFAANYRLHGNLHEPTDATLEAVNEAMRVSQAFWDVYNRLPDGDPIKDQYRRLAEDYAAKADELAALRQREYERGKGFQLFMRRNVVRPAGRLVGGIAHGLGKAGRVIGVLAKDELLNRVRDLVTRPLQNLTDLARGKVDLALARLAAKFGTPLAVLLEQLVLKPGLDRMENEITQLGGRVIAGIEDAVEGRGSSASEPTADVGDLLDGFDITGDDDSVDGGGDDELEFERPSGAIVYACGEYWPDSLEVNFGEHEFGAYVEFERSEDVMMGFDPQTPVTKVFAGYEEWRGIVTDEGVLIGDYYFYQLERRFLTETGEEIAVAVGAESENMVAVVGLVSADHEHLAMIQGGYTDNRWINAAEGGRSALLDLMISTHDEIPYNCHR